METICATGIRVSELRHITAEAVRCGRAQISMKGKYRTILIPGQTLQKAQDIHAKKSGIKAGEIFLSKNGSPLSQGDMGRHESPLLACRCSGQKSFSAQSQTSFARSFYSLCRDIVCLADVMGQGSIETTRIYLISTEAEYKKSKASTSCSRQNKYFVTYILYRITKSNPLL